MSLAELKLSVRASNCLESENIMTVRDLVRRSEDQLLEVRNFGETTLTEVKDKLRELGLHLGMRLPSAPPVGVLLTNQENIHKRLACLPCVIDVKAASSAAIPAINGRS